MITLKNEFISVSIAKKGAELKSLYTNQREYIWEADPAVWGKSCPVLFPICGGLKDGEYILDGKTYPLPRHGFARDHVYEVEKENATSATFLLKSSKETLEAYPFDFEFRVTYSLHKKKLNITYSAKNLSNDTMYFSFGGHEGFAVPEGLEEYDIVFEKTGDYYSTNLAGGLLDDTKTLMVENSNILPLKTDYFKVDTLIFENIISKSVSLKKKDGSREVKISFADFDHLMLWTVMGSKFLCIEPWNGLSDTKNTDKNIKTKLGIKSINKGESYTKTHTIEIVK